MSTVFGTFHSPFESGYSTAVERDLDRKLTSFFCGDVDLDGRQLPKWSRRTPV
jgi:hypothetical protein